MFDLKCKRMDCKFNEKCNCNSKKIEVNPKTTCKTYEDCGERKEMPDEIDQVPSRKNTVVRCKAKCLFNDNTVCKANGISVLTNNQSPQCSTFMPK